MSWIITGTQKLDPDAAIYIDRVESADGQSLEEGVKIAYSTFVSGCKTDGIWDAIKASCILAGARTLNGALVPLVGPAPTNVDGNFVAGDYNRETGLIGDGNTKYLNSNRNSNDDPQDNFHAAVYVSTAPSVGGHLGALDTTPTVNRPVQIGVNGSQDYLAARSSTGFQPSDGRKAGFLGVSRASSFNYTARRLNTTNTINATSTALVSRNIFVFSQNLNGSPVTFSDARLSFYSIGESLDLAALDTRVSTLMSDLAAAIP